ncbi:AMP-binding protein [Rubrivirga sp. IMCC45206]|uniref:AMP-binding protein n=1 Tax=Rubrivirga sp. IMCC45206 TaxID=3391614 RepID=UPI00398FB4C4
MTLADPVRQHAETRPDAPALLTPSVTWTWVDLNRRVDAASRALAGRDVVAVRAETSPDFVVLVLAALRIGAVLAPLSTRWPAPAVAEALARLRLDTVCSEADVAGVASAPLGDLLAADARGDGPTVDIPLDRPFTVVHTSGSTGAPKAVLHSVGNHVWSARGVIKRLGVDAKSRWLLDLPLYHVGGLGVVIRCALVGAALVLPDGASTADAVATLRPTHASLVATQLDRLLDADADLSSLRAVLLGGSAIPASLLDRAVAAGVPVATSYGMTEATATISATAPGADREALGTSGPPLAHRRVRIASGGEIEVAGLTVAGTWGPGGPEPPPKWLATGDLGHVDAAGRLVVTGRADLQFVSGGENVRPERIEAALAALPEVAEAVVVAVPDRSFGARPVAFVRTADGAVPDGRALAAALRERLAGFEVPVAFYDWDGAEGLKPDRPALTREAERRAAESRSEG